MLSITIYQHQEPLFEGQQIVSVLGINVKIQTEKKSRWTIRKSQSGRKYVFDEEMEKELSKCITVVCNCGFSPSMEELRVSESYLFYRKNSSFSIFLKSNIKREISFGLYLQNVVADYISLNNMTVHQFKEGIPGYTCIRNFLRHNKLSIKKDEMISSARLSNTANPFIIYDFLDQLEKVSCFFVSH